MNNRITTSLIEYARRHQSVGKIILCVITAWLFVYNIGKSYGKKIIATGCGCIGIVAALILIISNTTASAKVYKLSTICSDGAIVQCMQDKDLAEEGSLVTYRIAIDKGYKYIGTYVFGSNDKQFIADYSVDSKEVSFVMPACDVSVKVLAAVEVEDDIYIGRYSSNNIEYGYDVRPYTQICVVNMTKKSLGLSDIVLKDGSEYSLTASVNKDMADIKSYEIKTFDVMMNTGLPAGEYVDQLEFKINSQKAIDDKVTDTMDSDTTDSDKITIDAYTKEELESIANIVNEVSTTAQLSSQIASSVNSSENVKTTESETSETVTYEPITTAVNVVLSANVAKKVITDIIELTTPVADSITYGQPLSKSAIRSNNTQIGNFAWAKMDIYPEVHNNGYQVVFRPIDIVNYDYSKIDGFDATNNTINMVLPLDVQPAPLLITLPDKTIAIGDEIPKVTVADLKVEGIVDIDNKDVILRSLSENIGRISYNIINTSTEAVCKTYGYTDITLDNYSINWIDGTLSVLRKSEQDQLKANDNSENSNTDINIDAQIMKLEVPANFDVFIDENDVSGRGQIFSDDIYYRNRGDNTVVVNISNIVFEYEQVTSAAITKDATLQVIMNDGACVDLQRGDNQDVCEFELKPDESMSIRFSGSIAPGSGPLWNIGDAKITMVYGFAPITQNGENVSTGNITESN